MWQPLRANTRIGDLSAVLILFFAGCGGQADDQSAFPTSATGESASGTSTQSGAPSTEMPDVQAGEAPEPVSDARSGEGATPDAGSDGSAASPATSEPEIPASPSDARATGVTPVPPPAPASVREATAAIDLRELPRMEGAIDGHAQASLLVYDAPAEIPQAARFHVQQLAELDWQEDTGSTPRRIDEESAYLGFTHGNFYLFLSINRLPEPENEGFVRITLRNQGNVDATKLPRFGDAELLYGGQATAVYATPATVEEVVQFTRRRLSSLGWQEYEPSYPQIPSDVGNVGLNFRQNGIALAVYIRPATEQDDQTSVQYDTSVLNNELPVPPDAEAIEYDDARPFLKFHTQEDIGRVVQFYRAEAEEMGWTPKDDLTDTRDESTTVFFEDGEKVLYMLTVSKSGGDRIQVTLEGVLTQQDGA